MLRFSSRTYHHLIAMVSLIFGKSGKKKRSDFSKMPNFDQNRAKKGCFSAKCVFQNILQNCVTKDYNNRNEHSCRKLCVVYSITAETNPKHGQFYPEKNMIQFTNDGCTHVDLQWGEVPVSRSIR